MGTRGDFRDADKDTAVVVGRLLQCHAPQLEEAILNSNKTPVEDEDGFQTVRSPFRASRSVLFTRNEALAVYEWCVEFRFGARPECHLWWREDAHINGGKLGWGRFGLLALGEDQVRIPQDDCWPRAIHVISPVHIKSFRKNNGRMFLLFRCRVQPSPPLAPIPLL